MYLKDNVEDFIDLDSREVRNLFNGKVVENSSVFVHEAHFSIFHTWFSEDSCVLHRPGVSWVLQLHRYIIGDAWAPRTTTIMWIEVSMVVCSGMNHDVLIFSSTIRSSRSSQQSCFCNTVIIVYLVVQTIAYFKARITFTFYVVAFKIIFSWSFI